MVNTPMLCDILDVDVTVDVVDIGANPIDGDPPYQDLLARGTVRVVGFEPNRDALAELDARKGPHESYLPYAVADGRRHQFRRCYAPGMSSIFEPNMTLLAQFHGFPKWAEVEAREDIDTVRLDDVEEVENLDYLKIDVQGAELCVFENAPTRLAECVAIHTEVEFLPMYVDQPLFADVDKYLRGLGFVFHRFVDLTSRVVQPMKIADDPMAGLSQAVWADAVYIRDFTRFAEMVPGKLMKLAVVLHDVYGSYDVALRALMAHDDLTGTAHAARYRAFLAG
jgi:FkbM family methyltransferase